MVGQTQFSERHSTCDVHGALSGFRFNEALFVISTVVKRKNMTRRLVLVMVLWFLNSYLTGSSAFYEETGREKKKKFHGWFGFSFAFVGVLCVCFMWYVGVGGWMSG